MYNKDQVQQKPNNINIINLRNKIENSLNNLFI